MNFSPKDPVPVFFVLVSLFWCAHASAQTEIVLQDFSATLGDNTFFHKTWEATGTGESVNPNANFHQGAGVFDFAGSAGIVPTNDAGSYVEFFYSDAPLDIGASLFLTVSAQTLADNAATSFTVTLFDGVGGSAFAAFTTGDFSTGSYTEITAPLTFLNGFDPTHLDSMWLSGGQPFGTAAFDVSFDSISATSLTAVPELGSYALLSGLLALGVAVWRRRSAGV